jgi:hypothetical protein
VGAQLRVQLVEPETDVDDVDELTRDLRLELLELDVDSVTPVQAGSAPAGSKGPELAAVGALLVQAAGSASAIGGVITAVRAWLRRGAAPRRGVTITLDGHSLELTAATDDQQQRLIDEFVRAVAAP